MPYFIQKTKIRPVVLLGLLALIVGLSACGKKPSVVDPPNGADKKAFPLAYPDPGTDPAPVQAETGGKN